MSGVCRCVRLTQSNLAKQWQLDGACASLLFSSLCFPIIMVCAAYSDTERARERESEKKWWKAFGLVYGTVHIICFK